MSSRSSVWLLGRDFPELGPVGIVANARGGALALSRGRYPKPYDHVDPNEDAALLVQSRAGTLLAVTDGYNGAAASELAIQRLRETAGALLVKDPQRFESAFIELATGVTRELESAHRSRTCIVLIAAMGETCHVASFGDSAAFRAGDPEPLVPPNEFVLGQLHPGWRASIFATHFQRGSGERLAVVTDGVTNFTQKPGSISRCLAESDTDLEAARQIACTALDGGAGDNVAVVTCSGHD